jgi:hypothetical protein
MEEWQNREMGKLAGRHPIPDLPSCIIKIDCIPVGVN